MKRLFSVLLCVALLTALTPSVFAADGCAQIMSGTTWTFSESQTVEDYGRLVNNVNGSTVTIGKDSSLTGEEDDVLIIDKPSGGSNVNINFVYYDETVTASELKVAFDFKIDNISAMFKFVMKPSKSGSDLNVVEWQAGHIKFLGNSSVGTYSANKWYHVEMLFNIPEGYGQLKMKDYETSTVNTYNAIAKTGVFSGWDTTCRLAMGVQNTGIAYVDNYYQNYADVPVAFLGSDDFTDGIGGWTTAGGNMISTIYAQQVEVNGNKMLEIKADNAAEKKNTSARKDIPAYSLAGVADDVNYLFKFKLGGNAKPGTIGASMQTNDEGTNTEYFIVRVIDNDLKLFGGLTNQTGCVDIPSTFGVPTETNLYEVEAVYSPSSSTLTAVVTNDKGEQFIASTNAWNGTPNKFAFRHHVTEVDVTAVARFDDFETDILGTEGPEFVSGEVLSGFADAASLDETAVFTYDRTINQEKLGEATVTLNNEILSPEAYTIASKGNKVYVALKDLDLDTEYTVGLSSVADIIENVSDDEKVSTVKFTTSDVDIIATKPQLNGTILSTEVASYYAQGKAISLIVAVYNSNETELETVREAKVIADDRNGEVLSYDFEEILGNTEGKKIKGFVWSGFDSMTPYAEAYK